ncbi:hypothetical protein [uncultured Herbaspirillum sp.]|uniref:hypothetical protein n=1 Tax=uncultured Herbaspirillum sp. TaxID=160236 RepID=UPI002634E38F|nr:hypothetical protein [uncultured Herbaspirillum sp.]
MLELNEVSLLPLIEEAQRIETAAYLDMFYAAPEHYRLEQGIRTALIGDVTCFAFKSFPASLLNRTLCLGTSSAATEDLVRELHSWMRTYANPNFNLGIDINAKPSSLRSWLESAGLAPSGGGIARFLHAEVGVAPIAGRLSVRPVQIEERHLAGQLIRTAFGFPAHFDQWFSQIIGRENWYFSFVCDGAVPVSIGALYLKDEIAWLGVGGTLKEYRTQGAQNLSLHHRVQQALRLGAHSIHVETGHPGQGESIGPSYRNILRAGFKLMFVRTEFMSAPK